MSEQTPSYIGKLPCGCVVAASVDDAKDDRVQQAQWVAETILSGLTVERVTVQWVRENTFGRNCGKCQAKGAFPFNESQFKKQKIRLAIAIIDELDLLEDGVSYSAYEELHDLLMDDEDDEEELTESELWAKERRIAEENGQVNFLKETPHGS